MLQPQVMVIVLPTLALFAHLAQAGKEVSVEKFAAKLAIKTFNIGVLSRTGELHPVQVNLLALAPSLQHLADKFRAVIRLNSSRYAVAADQDDRLVPDWIRKVIRDEYNSLKEPFSALETALLRGVESQ